MVQRDVDDEIQGKRRYLSNRAVREATRLRALMDLYDREMCAKAARVQADSALEARRARRAA